MRVIGLLLAMVGAGLPGVVARAQDAPPLVIQNVNVLPMTTAAVVPGQTVLIEQGRIKRIGAAGKAKWPAGAVVVDGRGKYLLPGLIDMHAHLPGKEGTRHSLGTYFRLQLAAGVLGLRSMRGDSSHLRWRDSLRRTAAAAPRLYLGAPPFNRDKHYTAKRGRALLARYKASGYDFAKYLSGLNAAQFDSLLADARALGFKVAGHAPAHGLAGAVAAHLASVEHIEPVAEAYLRDSVQFRELARQMVANQVYFCPDEYWYQAVWLQYPAARLQQLPGLPYVESRIRQGWQAWLEAKTQQLAPGGVPTPAARQLAATLAAYHRAFRVLHETGVQVLVSPGDGPFVVPGYGMAEELRLLVGQGLSPYEALRAATVNAATWLGEADQRGRIVPGQAADLVLLDANPLADIGNVRQVRGVVLAGRWLPRTQLLPAQP